MCVCGGELEAESERARKALAREFQWREELPESKERDFQLSCKYLA